MAKKKLINQLPKVKEQVTGSYAQNLVGNKPVTPVAQVQASAVNPTAVGGNSYQSYVNGGAAVTPTAASAVTPGMTVNALRGQYAANLVKPKQMKNTVGGVITEPVVTNDSTGGSGDGKLEVEDPNSYIASLREREDSIVEQYDADKNYAEEKKADAEKRAEDNYNIALREAQANFRTNQPTYGLQAEQLLASGLTGSGYSDYLAGKAYEARTDEINAARSQRSYAEQLADENYRQMMYQAGKDKRDAENALSDWKMNYQVQLDAEYKAKVDEVLTGVLNGDYSAAVAETKLKNYAPGGVVSQDILDALKAQEEKYWWYNNSSVTGDYLSFMQAQIAEGNIVNKDTMRQWLKSSTNLDDNTIEFWVNSFTDENGNVDKGKVDDAVNGQSQNNGNTGNTGNSGNTGTSTGESKNRWSGDEAITRGNARFKNDAMGSRTDLGDGDNFNITVNGKTYRVESGGELADETVLAALKDAGIEDGEVFSYGDQAFLKKNGKYYEIDTRVFRPNAEGNLASAIRENTKATTNDAENVGDYSYTFAKNLDKFKGADDYKITNKTLKFKTFDGNMNVKIGAVLGKETAAWKAADVQGIKDGQAFIHGEDIYVKNGDKVYMVAEDKRDYEKLKTYLGYNQNSIQAPLTTVEVSIAKDENGKPSSSEFNMNINGTEVRVSKGIEHGKHTAIYDFAKSLGAKDGQMFLMDDKIYVYRDNSMGGTVYQYQYEGDDINDIVSATDVAVRKAANVELSPSENGGPMKIVYTPVAGERATEIPVKFGETYKPGSDVARAANEAGIEAEGIFLWAGKTFRAVKHPEGEMYYVELIPDKEYDPVWEIVMNAIKSNQ